MTASNEWTLSRIDPPVGWHGKRATFAVIGPSGRQIVKIKRIWERPATAREIESGMRCGYIIRPLPAVKQEAQDIVESMNARAVAR